MMSSIVDREWNRRQFLKAALAVAGGIVNVEPQECWGAERDEATQWAFLSDIHISHNRKNHYRGFTPYRNLQTVIDQVLPSQPEGVVITGDIARLIGGAGDYKNAKGLLRPLTDRWPLYMAVGNHDSRGNFLRAFQDADPAMSASAGKHIVTVDAGPVRLVLLDSLLFINMSWGLVGGTQRAWLSEYLRFFDDKPVLVCIHHDFARGTSLLDARPLLNLVRPMPHVKAIVHGHSHSFHIMEFDGIHIINLPATGYNLHDEDPIGWVEARLTPTEGRFVLHAIGGNTDQDGYTDTLRWRA